MAGQADGSIIIDTELNSDGFKAGSAELLAAIKSLSVEVKNLAQMLKEVFSKPLTPEINTSGAENKVAVLEAKVQELEDSLEGLQNVGSNTGTPETASPRVNMGGATQKASDLQRQIDSVNSSVERLEPTFQKAMSGNESSMSSFESKASALESKIAELQERLDVVGQTKFPTQEYEAIGAEAEKAEQRFDTLLDRQEKMQALGVNENSAQWKSLQYDMELVSNKYRQLIALKQQYEASGTAFQMGVDTTQYAQMEAALSAAASRLEEMRAGASQAEGCMSRLSGFARSLASHIGRAAKSVAGALVQGIRSAASHMAKLVLHGRKMNSQFGGLISGAKKFALSLLGARGVYALLRKAVSAYMAENQQLSNTLSACWSGIGNLLGPIITKLINLVAQAVAYVTSFLKLFGAFSNSATGAIQHAGNAASGAAKDLKRQLASFDELNILSDNRSNSGGDGASDAGAELPDVTLPDWARLMVEQIKAGDWAEAATTLAAQLTNMIESVHWDEIGQKIGDCLNGVLTFLAVFIKKFDWREAGSNLATLLNNIITSVNWENLGTVLGAKFRILLNGLTGFLSTFDWESAGEALGDCLNGLWDSIDWDVAAQGVNSGVKGIFTSIRTAVNEFNWEEVGDDIGRFINGVNWSDAFSDVTGTIRDVFSGVLTVINEVATTTNWGDMGRGLADSIKEGLKGANWSNVGTTLSNILMGCFNFAFEFVSNMDFGETLQGILDAIGDIIAHLDVWEILKGIILLIVSIAAQLPSIILGLLGGVMHMIGGLFESIGLDGVAGFFYGIEEGLTEGRQWLKENFSDPIVDWVKDLFGIHSPSKVFAEIGDYLIQGLREGIQRTWSTITDFFSGALSKVGNAISTAWGDVKTKTAELWGDIKGTISGVWDGIKTRTAEGYTAIKNGVSSAWGNVKSLTSEKWGGIQSSLCNTWNSVKERASTTWAYLKSTVSTAWNSVKSDTSEKWNGVKSTLTNTWNSIKSTASTTWGSLKSAIGSKWSEMKADASNTWDAVKSTLSSKWDSIKATASGKFDSLKSTIQNKGWSGVGSNICSGIQTGISNGWSWLKKTVSNLAQNLLNAAKDALGIHSPSRLFRDAVGLNIGLGIGEGIEASESSVLGSVTSVADAIADEFNAGEYKVGNIIPATEVDGALSSFADRITGGFTSLLDHLQSIAEHVTFTTPAVANGVVPYRVTPTGAVGDDSISSTIEASNDELASVVTQVVSNATASIVSAIQQFAGTTVNLDKASMADAVIREINRRTRMAGKSPLVD